jgi:hypothetical protein
MSATPSLARTLNTIHSYRDIDPHTRLWAAVLASGVADARAGDPEARLWLETCAIDYLFDLVPDPAIDCESLLSSLLSELPAPAGRSTRKQAVSRRRASHSGSSQSRT